MREVAARPSGVLGDHLAKLWARIEGQPPRLNQFLPSAPPGLEDVLLKMLARDPANRYQTSIGSAC
mgnify:CR=1 FL=1